MEPCTDQFKSMTPAASEQQLQAAAARAAAAATAVAGSIVQIQRACFVQRNDLVCLHASLLALPSSQERLSS